MIKRYFKRANYVQLTVLAAVLLVGLVAIIHFSREAWRAEAALHAKTKNIPAEVKEAYEGIQIKDDRMILERQLIDSGVAKGKIGETEASVCYLKSHSAGAKRGFIPSAPTVDYAQVCYVRITAGYYTDMTKNEVHNSLRQDIFNNYYVNGFYRQTPVDAEDCNLILTDSVNVKFAPMNSNPSLYEDRQGFVLFDDCARPSILQGTGSVGYGTALSSKVIKEIPDSTVDKGKNQIWLEEDIEYFSQSVGCGFTLNIFSDDCGMPHFDPVQ